MAAERMVEYLLSNLHIDRKSTLLDVYCGEDLFSAFLMPKVKKVIAIDSSASTCDDFVVNLSEFDNIELYEASAEHVLAHLNFRPDIVLVNPPRAELHYRALEVILRLQPPRGKYLIQSCHPGSRCKKCSKVDTPSSKSPPLTCSPKPTTSKSSASGKLLRASPCAP